MDEGEAAAAGVVSEGGGGSVPEAAEGKDDTPAAAGSSRSAKTLPRPAYEGDPQALINVCAAGGSGDVEEARDLLIARGINVDEQDEDQNTALYCATGHGDIDFVRELIRAGAALDVKNHIGKTALQKAREGHREWSRADVVALLEEAEAEAAAKAAVNEGGECSVPESAEGKDDGK